MGRTKGVHLRTTARVLVERYPNAFGLSYSKNKDLIKKIGLLKDSKEEQNKLAGEITNLVKKAKGAQVEEKAAAQATPA